MAFVPVGLALLLAGCAGGNYYHDRYGGSSESVPNYNYENSEPGLSSPESDYAPEPAAAQTPYDWPRVFVQADTTNTIYQPQFQSWNGSTVQAKSAVSVQSRGEPQQVFGLILYTATTTTNSDGTVTLQNPRIVSVDFPSTPDKGESYRAGLQQLLDRQAQVFSMGSLNSALAVEQEKKRAGGQKLDNAPPQIIFANQPSILVSIDGTPTFEPVTGADLDRVINTRVLLAKDRKTETFYLHVLNGYMQAPALEGPWRVGSAPPGAATLEKSVDGQIDLLEGEPAPDSGLTPALTEASAPLVFVATKPSELITFDGEPDFVPIPGTELLYVTNTTGNVFKLLSDQQTYVLLSGRWYRAPSFKGPWRFVPGDQLPSDFARIPDSSPKENVKASIPGTAQSKEALIANSIPKTTLVSKTKQVPTPETDGAPQLVAIAGTPLHYVANSSLPIIEVDSHSWYLCQDGVWYVSTAVDGPWTVADSVPAVIYSIPTSCPLHYVTYVRVYNTTPEVVYEGYTPGYLGTVVAPYGVVVYGTGYYYDPWIGSVWYGWPVTWGFGWDPFWTPWSGWCFGVGFGWPRGYYHHHHYWADWRPPSPRWGPYHYPIHGFGRHEVVAHRPRRLDRTSANVYRASQFPALHRNALVGPRRLNEGVYARAYNSRTGNAVAGEPARVPNVFHPPVNALRREPTMPTTARHGFFGWGARQRMEPTQPAVGAAPGRLGPGFERRIPSRNAGPTPFNNYRTAPRLEAPHSSGLGRTEFGRGSVEGAGELRRGGPQAGGGEGRHGGRR